MKLIKILLAGLICFGTLHAHGAESTLMPLLQKRHSGYAYDASKPLSKDQMQKLMLAAQTAPSCYNDQPWHFIFGDRNLNPEAYNKILNSLVEFNQGWAKNAPLLVVVTADTKFQENDKDNRWGSYDAGAAAFAMMLEATDMGLMAHQMGGFDEKKLQTDLNIPERYIPMAVMAIGFEAQGEAPKPKERKPLKENFFMGSWGK
jgi:nitroreductase